MPRFDAGLDLPSCQAVDVAALGINLDEGTFRFLADTGKIVLFLDAFDELNVSAHKRVVAELEDLSKRHDALRILISARPGSGIQHSPFFSIVDLSPLQGDEYQALIKRVHRNPREAAALIEGVAQRGERVKGVLTTPLIVALPSRCISPRRKSPLSRISIMIGRFQMPTQVEQIVYSGVGA